MATNLGGALYEWNSGQIIALFTVSFALFILFALQQTFTVFTTVTTCIFPIQLMKNWNAVLLFCLAVSADIAGFVPIDYVPLYFRFTKGDSATHAAVRLLLLIFVLSVMILANGNLMARFSYFQPCFLELPSHIDSGILGYH
ncbi:hypothetical protein VTH82DRAFT_7459 [Thermothelomyces myriococcoides]